MSVWLPQSVIKKKRDGHALSKDEINDFIQGSVDGRVDDTQVAAFCMAAFINDLSRDETIALTQAMANSGDQLDWSTLDLDGPVLDKHSSGGVGDKVSLILCPLIAACGGYAGKMSGRGLGHTGGTVDKLESIPGYEVAVSLDKFYEVVKTTGSAIIGQTGSFVPADKKFYGIRDVTGTVEHIGLITASILAKKLAVNSDAFTADIKVGNGAMMKRLEDGEALAKSIYEVANGAGLPTRVVLSDMNQVLGHSAGNAVEVIEALQYLMGDEDRDDRLDVVVRALASQMLMAGELVKTEEEAHDLIEQKLNDGSAAECFNKSVAALGGPKDIAETFSSKIELAAVQVDVQSSKTGYITAIDTLKIGEAIVQMGGGRTKPNAPINHRVGLTHILHIGDYVEAGQTPLCQLHLDDEQDAEVFAKVINDAITIDDAEPSSPSIIYKTIV